MENPFKQFHPDSLSTQETMKQEVMNSVKLKSYFAHILEFFFAIFGDFSQQNSQSIQAEKAEKPNPNED